jgi:hypothetical protein
MGGDKKRQLKSIFKNMPTLGNGLSTIYSGWGRTGSRFTHDIEKRQCAVVVVVAVAVVVV